VGATQPVDRCRGRLLGKLRRTTRRWPMLGPGERVALGISGGRDSLALALLVAAHSRTLPVPLELIGLHVALDSGGLAAPLGDEVHRWCARLGFTVIELEPRLDATEMPPLSCFGCAHVRRRTLLEAADARGMRQLALGHHADDVVETWLMGLLYTGNAEALRPCRSYFDGSVVVVRPLYEIKNSELVRLTRLAQAPVHPGRCPQDGRTRRARVKAALGALGTDQRRVRRQVFWAAVRQLEARQRDNGSVPDGKPRAAGGEGG